MLLVVSPPGDVIAVGADLNAVAELPLIAASRDPRRGFAAFIALETDKGFDATMTSCDAASI